MNYKNISKNVGFSTFLFKGCFLGSVIMDEIEAKASEISRPYWAWYKKATKCNNAKLSQMKRDIRRGQSKNMRIIIEGYGAMLKAQKDLLEHKKKYYEEKIKEVKRESYRIQQEEIKRISNIARDDERFMIDFIQSLDPKTVRRANDEYWEKFGRVMGGGGFKSVGFSTHFINP